MIQPPDSAASLGRLLSGVAARGPGLGYVCGLAAGLQDVAERVHCVYDGLSDVELADGEPLEVRAAIARVPRGGLSSEDWRRLVAATEAAALGAVTPPAVWAIWTQLAGTDEGSLVIASPGAGVLWSTLPYAPSEELIARAGVVLASSIGAFRLVLGILRPPGGMLLAGDGHEGLWGPLSWRV